MLPYDRRPWAKSLAIAVIAVTIIGIGIYAVAITRERTLDTGEKAILLLLLLTVIPPNLVIIRRRSREAGSGIHA